MVEKMKLQEVPNPVNYNQKKCFTIERNVAGCGSTFNALIDKTLKTLNDDETVFIFKNYIVKIKLLMLVKPDDSKDSFTIGRTFINFNRDDKLIGDIDILKNDDEISDVFKNYITNIKILMEVQVD